MERVRCNTELFTKIINVKPSNFWGSHHFPPSVFPNAQAMPPSPPTTTPKFRSGRSADASLWPTTTYPTNHPKSKVRKGVAPLPLRSVPPSSPTTALSREFGKVSLRKAPLWYHHQPPPTTLSRAFGKVSLRYRFASYRHRPQPPP